MRRMDEARTGLTAVLSEVRRREKEVRGAGGAAGVGGTGPVARGERLRELRVRESRLHQELGRLRAELERVRAEVMRDP